MRGRPGWLLPVLVVVFVTVPILEVWLLITVGRQIGVLPTLGILVLEAMIGAWLMRREGIRAWSALNSAFASGQMPTDELADAALVLVGGVFLLLPGFATDVIGLLCLLPFTRPLIRRILTALVARRLEATGLPVRRVRPDSFTVIEGEVVEPTPPSPPAAGEHNRVLRGGVEDDRA